MKAQRLVDDQKGTYSKEVQKHFKLKINGKIYTQPSPQSPSSPPIQKKNLKYKPQNKVLRTYDKKDKTLNDTQEKLIKSAKTRLTKYEKLLLSNQLSESAALYSPFGLEELVRMASREE
ncbi:hypothetical protein [Priestia megaterium]|jgi:hypothetical protein|uniref:hypothetical protein n=1 Tax=Priestia megaterium TaxID=1404 RepID=UPI00186644B6|nr:hypothetical protein [Priestia megaterium]MBE2972925.1 hypothetical protein [Priestia megaterium]MCY9020561.1 hypothetical protein [Priestia megaterium]MCY9025318.1 hypothetical protein [Priestia megaterium]